jgi:hypothetical protein
LLLRGSVLEYAAVLTMMRLRYGASSHEPSIRDCISERVGIVNIRWKLWLRLANKLGNGVSRIFAL